VNAPPVQRLVGIALLQLLWGLEFFLRAIALEIVGLQLDLYTYSSVQPAKLGFLQGRERRLDRLIGHNKPPNLTSTPFRVPPPRPSTPKRKATT